MATLKAFIRITKQDKEVNIRFRLCDGKDKQLFYSSDITVKPNLWCNKNEQYLTNNVINNMVAETKQLILKTYNENKDINSKQLKSIINKSLNKKKVKKPYLKYQDFHYKIKSIIVEFL